MTTNHVGVDISKASFDAAHLSAEGKYKHKKFPNTPDGFAAFVAWLLTFGGDKPLIGMEATGAYSIPLADFLVGEGSTVSVVNPAKIHAFARSELSRAKTDKADAKLIARFMRELAPFILRKIRFITYNGLVRCIFFPSALFEKFFIVGYQR